MANYKLLKRDELIAFGFRDLREDIIDRLVQRITGGFNPARPLTVVPQDGKYLVADGNHRLTAIDKLGIKDNIPCIIRDSDPYKLAIECNEDEETYAPLDLFDWLDIIKRLRDEGFPQEKIGNRIGWTREAVKNYITIIDKIGTETITLAINHQEGRVPKSGTVVPFLFTEWWLRESGLYDLQYNGCKYQKAFMERFFEDKCGWKKDKVQTETTKYKAWQDFNQIGKDTLVNQADLAELIKIIENGTFQTENQVRQKINDFNSQAQNKLICGDAITELQKLDDASIDVVITDPPYGIDYISHRSKFKEHITAQGIENDKFEASLGLLDTSLNILTRKTKPDAHIYIFTSWKVYPSVQAIIAKYFDIKSLIVWDKGLHGAGDLQHTWGNQYELIIFASKGSRTLNYRPSDIVRINKIASDKLRHPVEKPIALITELLKASARKADTICDPFMGAGSTIKAIKDFSNLFYIGIELDKITFEKARSFIEGDNNDS